MKFYLDPADEGTRRKRDAETFYLRLGLAVEDEDQGSTFMSHGWYWTPWSGGAVRGHRGNESMGPFGSEALAVADARKRYVEARERLASELVNEVLAEERADKAAVRALVESDTNGKGE